MAIAESASVAVMAIAADTDSVADTDVADTAAVMPVADSLAAVVDSLAAVVDSLAVVVHADLAAAAVVDSTAAVAAPMVAAAVVTGKLS
jgi:hypothetical protein